MKNNQKELQFKKCHNCRFFYNSITKQNGSEKIIQPNREVLQECNYGCYRSNNYIACNDFLNYKKYPNITLIKDVIEKQEYDRTNIKKFIKTTVKVLGIALTLVTIVATTTKIIEFF